LLLAILQIFFKKSKKEKKKQAPTKFKSQFGQHLTYMYMLPETEQTYLRQPISPHPPQPTQFHTPHGPVIKIRKSRYSMLKTGMQRLSRFDTLIDNLFIVFS
jgi:hypothetical protein